MDHPSILSGIAAVQFLAAASPGPTFIVVSSHAVGQSRRRCFLVVGGVLLADLLWAVLAASGLGLLMLRYPATHAVLPVAGAAYLVWLGGRMLLGAMRAGTAARIDAAAPGAAGTTMRNGFLTNLLNPKSIAYYSSLFVVMIPADPPPWLFAAAVVSALLVSAAWWIAVALFFGTTPVRRAYERARRGIDAAMGGVLVCLGVRLALSR